MMGQGTIRLDKHICQWHKYLELENDIQLFPIIYVSNRAFYLEDQYPPMATDRGRMRTEEQDTGLDIDIMGGRYFILSYTFLLGLDK